MPGATKEFSIRDIEDLEMRYKVIQMRKSQPHRLYQVSKTTLEQVHGDFDEASALLLSRQDYNILPQAIVSSYHQ